MGNTWNFDTDKNKDCLKDFVSGEYYNESSIALVSRCLSEFENSFVEPIRQQLQPEMEKTIEKNYKEKTGVLEEQCRTDAITNEDYAKTKAHYKEEKEKDVKDMHKKLKAAIESELANNPDYVKYKSYYKLFFMGNAFKKPYTTKIAGELTDATSQIKGITTMRERAVVIFANKDLRTVPHELLHALQLEHSFAARLPYVPVPGKYLNSNALFTYKVEKTDNIMDYNPTQTDTTTVEYSHKYYNTWCWQWELIWKDIRETSKSEI